MDDNPPNKPEVFLPILPTFTELPHWVIAWCGFALFCGGLIKGTLGVGTPLLTVPMLTLVLPAQIAVTIMAIPIVCANALQVFNASNLSTMSKRLLPAAVALLAGTFIGVNILSTINEQTLLRLVGVLVIAMTFLQVSDYKLSLADKHIATTGVVFGLFSGVVGGVSSMFGPMLILYLVSIKHLDKNDFVSGISFLYLCAVVPWTIGLIAKGLLTQQLLVVSALATAPVLAGIAVGQRVRQYVSDQHFQKLILLILLVSGTSMIWQSL